MLVQVLSILLVAGPVTGDQPLPPAWSPDHATLAQTQVGRRFVTPAGADFCLLFGNRPVYPDKCAKRHRHAAYSDIHTFLSDLVWSPDSNKLAFVERVYDWEYDDPYNRDFNGVITRQKILLAIIPAQGEAAGYELHSVPKEIHLSWRDADHLRLNGRIYDLRDDAPSPIH